jgi:hypothetical protein
MKKYISLITPEGIVFETPLDVVAKIRAIEIAKNEAKTEDDFDTIFYNEFETGMEEDDIIESWAKKNLKFEEIVSYSIRMDILKDKSLYSKDWRENIKIVFH